MSRDGGATSASGPAGVGSFGAYDDGSDEDDCEADARDWSDAGDVGMYGWADAEDPLRGKVDLALVAGERTGTEAVDRRKSVLWPSSPGSSRSKSEDSDVSKASRAVRIPGSVPEHLRRSSRVQRFLVRMVRGICGGTRQEYIGEDHGLKGKALIYFTTVFVSLGVFLFGYDQGVMSGIIT